MRYRMPHPSPPPSLHPHRPASGFTLVELIVVMVITSIIGLTLMSFMQPTLAAYFATRARTELAGRADTALRQMLMDTRRAVPNSLRIPSDQCFEVVPAVGGGRYRSGPDVRNDTPSGCASGSSSTCSAWVDTTMATTVFDVLNVVNTAPKAEDWVVVGNQNGNDVYAGLNRARVSAVSTPQATQGVLRVRIDSTQFPQGYTEGRYQVVSSQEPSVFYVCSGADGSTNGQGDGKGTLYRVTRPFNASYPTACPSVLGAAVVSTQVQSCAFIYDANHGATQQSGFLWLDMAITRNGETAHLAVGAHIRNVP